ncbi:MAG: hypothetical protein HN377_04850 [Alphaproteobacteria bacterium]|jgi:hypothetical protein|nr:hypothetical protein [Alphaproteobacteria bacterium]
MTGKDRKIFPWLLGGLIGLALFGWSSLATAQQPQRPTGGKVSTWNWDGLSLEVAPLPIEPATAFFSNRGFPYQKAIKLAQNGCIFRSAIGHEGKKASEPPVHIDVRDWSLKIGGVERAYRTKEEWLARFEKDGVPEDARIAFQWATFPTSQTFLAQDYNWGIHAFDLPAGTTFDLTVVWRYGKYRKRVVLKDLECSVNKAKNETK